ncbi:MAG: VanZ family protein [Microgenomates group bacterium]
MHAKILKKVSLWLPVVIWGLIIFNLSGHKLVAASPEYWKDFIFKKSAHLFFYGIFAVLFYRALRGEGAERINSAYLAILLAFIYGATDEFHQSFVMGREPTVRDLLIDTAGAGIASFLLYYLLPKCPKEVKHYLNKLGLN